MKGTGSNISQATVESTSAPFAFCETDSQLVCTTSTWHAELEHHCAGSPQNIFQGSVVREQQMAHAWPLPLTSLLLCSSCRRFYLSKQKGLPRFRDHGALGLLITTVSNRGGGGILINRTDCPTVRWTILLWTNSMG